MIKGVLFDMDGVMFDTEQLGLDVWDHLGKLHGFEMPRSLWLSVLGLRSEEIAQVIQKNLGPSFPFLEYWEELKQFIDQQIALQGTPKKPGLVPLLEYLKANGYRFTVATSTLRSRVENYMEKAGVRSYFGEIVCGDMVERSKPAPDIYLKAARTIGLPPDACIALEDSPRGILSAYAAGVHPVFIPDLLPIDSAVESLLYAKVSSLSDIIPLLEQTRHAAEDRK
ncbi:MAG: HAD family phosphatase [Oscillospiraceae bacterium]|nr:HAD family phosphatase [Oscillospiraceae bacterium]